MLVCVLAAPVATLKGPVVDHQSAKAAACAILSGAEALGRGYCVELQQILGSRACAPWIATLPFRCWHQGLPIAVLCWAA